MLITKQKNLKLSFNRVPNILIPKAPLIWYSASTNQGHVSFFSSPWGWCVCVFARVRACILSFRSWWFDIFAVSAHFNFLIPLKVLEAPSDENWKPGKCVLGRQLALLQNPFFTPLGKEVVSKVGFLWPPSPFDLCLRNKGMRAKSEDGWGAEFGERAPDPTPDIDLKSPSVVYFLLAPSAVVIF